MPAVEEALEELGIAWSGPVPLEDAVRGAGVPALPGLYRIRRVGLTHWDYIGQTGVGWMNLRRRMAMLRGIYAEQMPYRDPHTAGPGLWALRHRGDELLEVSFCPVEAATPWRKGLEAVAIALHRQDHGRSPTLSFGRMPAGYRMSSGNNARLVAAGRRFRGGPTDGLDDSHAPGVPPIAPLGDDVLSANWCGHEWTDWSPLTTEAIQQLDTTSGLYRIRGRTDELVYVGEGAIRARLLAHALKLQAASAQGDALRANAPLAFSIVYGHDWLRHQRLEFETDLIGAHVLATRHVPAAQFIG